MANPCDPLFEHYPEVIAQMPPAFTSHQFILHLAQQYQQEYVEALYAYRGSLHRGKPAPFLVVHGLLAQHLQGCPNLVTQVPGMVPSLDIFDESTTCAQWRKV